MSKKSTYLLIIIIAGALIVRLWGIHFGLPNVYHWDEERIVHHALAFGLGDFNPHYFNYPSFSMYLLFFEYGVYYILGRLFGWFPGIEAFQRLFFSDPTSFYLIGRISTALLGTATVFLVFKLGKKVYDTRAGLGAAFFLAINLLHVESSHYITTDVLLTFFIVASYIYILSILTDGRKNAYIWAGVLAGLGAASKYNAATLAVPIFLAHWWGPAARGSFLRRIFHKYLWLAGGCMLLAFSAASPYCVLDFPKFWADLRGISEHMKIGVYGTGGGRQWCSYFTLFFRYGTRWEPMGLIYGAGFVWALLRRRKQEWLLLSYPVLYFLMIGSWGVCNPRYFIPVYPTLAVLSGGALATLRGKAARKQAVKIGLVGCVVLLSILPLKRIMVMDIKFSRTDTRTLARQWIEENVKEGTKIAVEWDNNSTVQLQPNKRTIRETIEKYRKGELETVHHPAAQMIRVHRMRLEAEVGKTYNIVKIGAVGGLTLVPERYSLKELESLGVEYIVVSSDIYDWLRGEKERRKYPRHAAFYDELFDRFKPVKIFQPDDSFGPTIRIYQLP